VGKPKGKIHLEDLGVDGGWFQNASSSYESGEKWTGLIWFRIRTGKCGNASPVP
jgi:hypothetical protein